MKDNELAMKHNYHVESKWFDASRSWNATPPHKGLYGRIGKRGLDIILALVLLPLVAPLVGLFLLLTRRDGGPGLFVQERVGQDGRVFKCLKIRTMLVNAEEILEKMCAEDPELAAEWHLNQKLKNDPRITRVGNFLRKTSMDELPQLFNVLRGDMSLVGPRPMLPSQQELYLSGNGGNGYFALRPGITGAWQVDGRGKTSFLDRVRFDNQYLAELSVGKDLAYMVRTVSVLFRGTGQ
jgi:lipopolysaccharide/colanic/teichoic acid biosynthesis glycosyltransferase